MVVFPLIEALKFNKLTALRRIKIDMEMKVYAQELEQVRLTLVVLFSTVPSHSCPHHSKLLPLVCAGVFECEFHPQKVHEDLGNGYASPANH